MYEPNTGTDFAYRTMPGVIELSLGNANTANAALIAAPTLLFQREQSVA